jgi:tetratricopeptide (TPR) repeat protein
MFLALLSKEIAVILPVALILCEYYKNNFDFKKIYAQWRSYSLYFLVGIFYVFIYLFVMPSQQKIFYHSDLLTGLLRMFDVFGLYFKDLIWPQNITFVFPMALKQSYPRIILVLFIILACFYVVLKKKASWKEISFGIAWFFLWAMPVNNFINSFRILLANRFMYVPIFGFSVVIGVFAAKLWESRSKFLLDKPILKYALPLSLAGIYFIFTFSANALWKNALLICSAAVEKYPDNPAAHIEYGDVLLSIGDIDSAEKELNIALAQFPITSNSINYLKTYSLLGLVYEYTGRYKEAELVIKRGIGVFPNTAFLYFRLGGLYTRQAMYDSALEQLNIAKKMNPGYIPAYLYSGRVYMLQQKYREAKTEFLRVNEMGGDYPDARLNLDKLEELEKANAPK